jgi:hypothetical protein
MLSLRVACLVPTMTWGLLHCLLAPSHTWADERVPFVRIGEEGGHLKIDTCLAAGHLNVSATERSGLQLRGFVHVQSKGKSEIVRVFRLKGAFDEPGLATVRDFQRPLLPGEFLVDLRPTSNPTHYTLRLKVGHTVDGRTVQDEGYFGRNCCGYYVQATRLGVMLPIARARLASELIQARSDTYRQFEAWAVACSRPGFALIPGHSVGPDELVHWNEAPHLVEFRSQQIPHVFPGRFDWLLPTVAGR